MNVTALFFIVFSFCALGQGPNSWVEKNRFGGFKREQATGCATSTKGYLGTGVDTSETVRNDWWEYDPITDAWSQKANVPGEVRRCAFSFSLNDLVYVGAGVNAAEAQTGLLLNDFHEFNPILNTWTTKAIIPLGGGLGVYYCASFVADNKAYVVGGKIGPSNYTSQMMEYKPSSDTWLNRANFPGGSRYNMSATTVNNIGYVGLGTNFDNYMSDWFAYNPGSNTWEEKTSFIGGDRAGASAFSINGKAFVCLGSNGGMMGDLYEYNTILNNWSPRSNYGGSERKQAVAFVINNRAYVGTGSGAGGKKNTMYEYLPLSLLDLEEYKSEISIYPNPSSDFIQICSESSGFRNAKIISLNGKVSFQFEVTNQNENSHFDQTFDISTIPTGSYFLVLTHSSGIETVPKKISIAH